MIGFLYMCNIYFCVVGISWAALVVCRLIDVNDVPVVTSNTTVDLREDFPIGVPFFRITYTDQVGSSSPLG